ncbi:MAG: hypothetical protein GY870_01240 [archaeon]|nr:hypothetical protein [archaeon]
MNFRERINITINNEEPDRIPIMGLIMDPATSDQILNKKPVDLVGMLKGPLKNIIKTAYNNDFLSTKFITSAFGNALEAAEKLGFDANWIVYPPYFKFVKDPESKVGIVWHDLYGRQWELEPDGNGWFFVNYTKALVPTEEKWDKWMAEKAPLFENNLKCAKKFYNTLIDKYHDRIYTFPYAAPGVWENSWQPMGFPNFVKFTRKNPSFIKRVIDFHTDYYLKHLEIVCNTNTEVVFGGDDLGYKTGPLINPKQFKELFFDGYKRIAELVHKKGKKLIWHSCGRIYEFLDMFVEAGIDGIITMEPTAGMELKKVRDQVGHKLILIGNLDVSYLLVQGTKDEIEMAVKNAIRDAGPGGGYILSTCHSHGKVDPVRLKWMVEFAKKYGEYPIKI